MGKRDKRRWGINQIFCHGVRCGKADAGLLPPGVLTTWCWSCAGPALGWWFARENEAPVGLALSWREVPPVFFTLLLVIDEPLAAADHVYLSV